MSQPSPESPVKFEVLVKNLSERDLRANLATPSYWDRVSRFLPTIVTRRAATYHAVTGQPHRGRLMDALSRMRVLDADSAQGLQEGRLSIPSIDQLAISRQPEQVINGLGKKGFGIWPVSSGISMADINTGRLGMVLTRGQRDVLERYEGAGREEVGLWIRGGLVADKNPLDEEYLPTLPEILYALVVYKDQEGHLPDSKGKWLLTGSKAAISLKDAYDRLVLAPAAKDLFIEACIQTSPLQEIIRKHSLIIGDFSSTEQNENIQAERSGNQYKLTDRYGTPTVRFWTAGNYFANILLQNGNVRLVLNSTSNEGKVTVRDEFGTPIVRYDSPYETVLREINRERQLGANLWDRVFGLPLVFSVEPENGVRIGVLDSVDRQNTRWTLAGGYLHLDYWPVLEKDLKSQLAGLELVNQALWPMIIPDTYAAGLLKGRR